MTMFVDLHIHSKHSRATSKDLTVENLAKYAKIKGLDCLGTGDFLHPHWIKELKSKLQEENGIYFYDGVKFIPTVEISLAYTQDKKGRRIHHLITAPSLETVDQITEWFLKKGRIDYDGRPIFGFSSIELVEAMMSISKDILVIPAHCMTPWFGIFGSMSGFDSLKECFQEKTKHVYAVETGLSADPSMLWRISNLDNISLVSFSDNHSFWPWRLGRECTDLGKIENYKDIFNAIKNQKIKSTVEFFPEEGKYHYDGHRDCSFSCGPEETKKLGGKCQKCGLNMTIGVMSRVEQLADRPEGYKPEKAKPFKSLVPLSELISHAYNTTTSSKKTWEIFNKFISVFGNEFNVMLSADEQELKKIDERTAFLIEKNRSGEIKMVPGYDGVYGKLIFNGHNEKIPEIKNKIQKDASSLKRFL